jgi:hypothetical protein
LQTFLKLSLIFKFYTGKINYNFEKIIPALPQAISSKGFPAIYADPKAPPHWLRIFSRRFPSFLTQENFPVIQSKK